MELADLINEHRDEILEKLNDDLRPIALRYWEAYCTKVDDAIDKYQAENPGHDIPTQRNTDPEFRKQVTRYINGDIGETTEPTGAGKVAKTQIARAFFEWLTS